MKHVLGDITIDARPAQVWPYITTEKLFEWQHHSGPYPALKTGTVTIEDDPNGDKTGQITGTTTDGTEVRLSLIEYNEPRYIVFRAAYVQTMQIEQFITMELEPAGEDGTGTLLTVVVEWQIDGAPWLLRILAGAGAKKSFGEMITESLQRLQTLVEREITITTEEASL